MKYLSVLRYTIIGVLLSIALFYWGYLNDGYLRMIIGTLIALAFLKSGLDNILFIIELKKWKKENQDKLILFYPAKKKIQELIKNEIIDKLTLDFLEVYYDGPKLVGDIKTSITIELLKWNSKINIHEPALLKIRNEKIIIESLEFLTRIDREGFDYIKARKEVIQKLNKLKSGE